jgi:23S rRNA (cytosine1962-C5)-methyltransferase
LEKFGKLTLDRPDPSVVWSRGRNNLEWRDADSRFEPTSRTKGNWSPAEIRPKGWQINYKSPKLQLRFHLEMTSFKHVGIFPEQAANWEYIVDNVTGRAKIPEPVCIHRWCIARSTVQQALM